MNVQHRLVIIIKTKVISTRRRNQDLDYKAIALVKVRLTNLAEMSTLLVRRWKSTGLVCHG